MKKIILSPLNVAIYARVSSEQQADAATIASQVAALKERIAADHCVLEPELSFLDEGYSGATLIRPALERLRDLAATGAIDRLYVHSPDRLARKYAYQVLLLDEFEHGGVEVVFLDHPRSQTAEEELLVQVQGMVAEYERAKILERSRRGKLHAARQGSINVLSGAPYGYRYVRAQEGNGEARYDILLEEARVVRQIFQWIGRDGLSIGEVCRRLKRRGIPTRTGKSSWDRTTVWAMLKNPAYRGAARFGKTRIGPRRAALRPQRGRPAQPRRNYSTYDQPEDQGVSIAVPALVNEAIFFTVQERLAENRLHSRQRQRGAKYLLQGLVVCRRCGYAFYGKPVSIAAAKGKQRHYAYYRCLGTDAYRFGGERICHNRQLRTDLLDEAVWEDVCALLRDPKRIQQEYQRRLTHKESPSPDAQQLENRIHSIKRGITRLVDAYQDGLLEKSDFEPRIRRLRERLAKLEADAKESLKHQQQQATLRLVIGQLEEFARQVENGLQDAPRAKRREILRALVKRVEVDEDQVQVIYRIDPPPFDPGPKGGRLQDCWRRDHSPLRASVVRITEVSLLHHSGVQPFTNQSLQHSVTHSVLEKLSQMGLAQRVEKFADINLQNPTSCVAHRLAAQLFQRLVRRSLGSETVGARMKILLVNRLQQHDDRPLEHFILQGRNSDRAGLGGRAPFRNVHPPHRRCPVAAGLRPVEK